MRNLLHLMVLPIVLSLFLISTVYAEDNLTEWYTTAGGSGLDIGCQVQQTKDGGYIVAGYTTSFGAGGVDIYLAKFNALGYKQWEKTYGDQYDDYGYSVKETNDGYVIAGSKGINSSGESDAYLIKTDASGKVEWEKTYGDSGVNEEAFSVVMLEDGYALAGYKSPGIKGAEDAYILKVDLKGDLLWENTFGDSSRDRGVSIKETNDGGLIIAGWQDAVDSDLFQTDAYLLRLDRSGNKIWENNYGGASNDKGVDVVEAADGSFAITGITKSEDNGDEDLYLIRADAQGAVKWGKSFGGSGDDAGQSVIVTEDGGLLALGWKEVENGDFENYIVKTDSHGDKEWEKTFGGPYEDRGRSFQATTDGGVIVAGQTNSYGIEGLDEDTGLNVYLAKIPGITVQAKAEYDNTNKTVSVEAEAFCIFHGDLDPSNTMSVVCEMKDAQNNSLGISNSLDYNSATQKWEALNVDVTDIANRISSAEVTFLDQGLHQNSKTVDLESQSYLGVSSPYVLNNGEVLVYASMFANGTADLTGALNVQIKIDGVQDPLLLNDSALPGSGDFHEKDGIYSTWVQLSGNGEKQIELYLDDKKIDSKTVNVITRPELAITTNLEALYKEFADTGTNYLEDLDGNKLMDYYDLLDRIYKYASNHRGIVFDVDQEISADNGYSDDYSTLSYSDNSQRLKMGNLVDSFIEKLGDDTGKSIKNQAIIGGDEVVPFYRRTDVIKYEHEYLFPGEMNGDHGNPSLYDTGQDYILTDLPYSTYSNISPDSVKNPKPDMGIGRIFGDHPANVINEINAYEAPLNLSASSNASFFNLLNEDAPDPYLPWEKVVDFTLDPVLKNHYATGLLTDVPRSMPGRYYQYNAKYYTWTKNDVTGAMANTTLTMMWAHAAHNVFVTPKATPAGPFGAMFAADIYNLGELPGHLVISTGCHSGYSVSHNSSTGDFSSYDISLVKAILNRQMGLMAPTTYGIGGGDSIALHDLLLQRFLDNLFTSDTIGQAYIAAYDEYWRSSNTNDTTATYCSYGMAYYGLPTQTIKHGGTATIKSSSLEKTNLSGGSGPETNGLKRMAVQDLYQAESEPLQTETFSVNIPELVMTDVNGKALIELPNHNGTIFNNSFAPALPLVVRSFLLPEGSTVSDVKLTDQITEVLPGTVDPLIFIPVNRTKGPVAGTADITNPYPDKIFWWSTTNRDGGVMLNLSIVPVSYNTDTRVLTLYKNLNFEIAYTKPAASAAISSVTINEGNNVEVGTRSIPVSLTVNSSTSRETVLRWKVKSFGGLILDGGSETVQLNSGDNQLSFNTREINWELGQKDIQISISDGSVLDSSNKQIEVTETQVPADADLRMMDLDEYSLSPAFDPAVTSYSTTVKFDEPFIHISTDSSDPAATMTIDGESYSTGYSLVNIGNKQQAEILITVTASDGTTKKTYTLNVNREAPPDILTLSVSPGALVPAFDPAVTDYTVNVSSEISTIDIKATISKNASSLSGSSGPNVVKRVNLNYGVNTIKLEVQAESYRGTMVVVKTYNIIVTRNVITANANLKLLQCGTYNRLAPDFKSDTTLYFADITESYVDIKATPDDISATMTFDGAPMPSDKYCRVYPNQGWNFYKVEVTARDGITKKTYTVKVHRYHSGQAVPQLTYDPDHNRYLNVYIKKGDNTNTNNMVAQLLDEGGNPIGGEIMFGNPNSYDKSSVAYGDGKYFIVWAAAGGACLLDADGNVLMDEFSVLPKKELTFPQYDMYLYPSVTYDSDNKHFLVVAELDHYVSALLPFQFGIAGRLFNTDGTAVGEPFVISSPLTTREGAGLESYPAAAYDPANKRYLVAWNKMMINNKKESDLFDIYGQLLDSNGTLLNTTADTNFVISDDITNDFLQSLTYDSNNNRFLPVWIKDIYGSSNSGLEGRLINGDGTMYGSSFIITDLTYYTHQYRTRKLFSGFSNPSQIVFKNNENRYLALWSTDDPGLDYNVYGRYFSADGKNMEDPFVVSNTDQDETSISAAYNSRTGDVRAALEVHCNGIPTTAVTNIIGKPAPLAASIEFSGEAYNINETAGQAIVTVIRSGNTDSEVTAAYSTKDGTAITGTDYTAVSGTLTFAKGETEKTFNIPIIDDALSEADKTIEINLSDPSSGAVLGVKKTAYLTIVDDDNRVNNPPTAVSDTAATKESVPVIIEVLKNDIDPDGDNLVITEVTQGSGGKVIVNQNKKSVTYTPDAGFTGEDTFTYTLSDGKDGIAVGTVSITVTANTGTNPDHNSHTHKTPIPDEEVPGSPLLNKVDHIAYIQGYPDNSVKPEGYVTREEAAAVFFRLLDPAYRSSILNTNNIFGDVDANRWSSKYIATLSEGKILLGYPDGSFKPGKYITRAELATIAAKFDDSSTPDTGKFTDVSGSWAEKFINSAAQKGWANGYPDGSFKPDQYITRAEFVTLVNNVLDRKVHTENVLDGLKEFPDLIKGKWYFEEINEAVNSHHYERLPDGFEKWIDIYNPDVEM